MSARLPEQFDVWIFSHILDFGTVPVAELIPLSLILDRCEMSNMRLATREEVETVLGCDLQCRCVIVIDRHPPVVDLYAADVRGSTDEPTLFYVGQFSETEALLPSAAGYIVCKK
jgi:hypothetical protein